MAPVVRRWVAVAAALAVLALVAVLLVTRSGGADKREPPDEPMPTIPEGGSVAPLTPETALRPEVAALALVPAESPVVTITDWDAIRARLGVPDLTSEDLMTDRSAFWERARREAVLLSGGLLVEDGSQLWLDYDVSQDDVDWEARFVSPTGIGYVLAFRPDLDMTGVEAAVADGVGDLAGATVWADLHLVVHGAAPEGEPVWASDPELVGLVPAEAQRPAETTYLRRGCIPMDQALGTDATVEDQDAVLAEHDVAGLDELSGVGMTFGDDVATAWFEPGRDDLADRAALVDDWPTTGAIGWGDGFSGSPAVDPSTGRLGLRVANPAAAAALTLTDQLPFGICNDVVPIPEPTGL
jgi:hypothetical protein